MKTEEFMMRYLFFVEFSNHFQSLIYSINGIVIDDFKV